MPAVKVNDELLKLKIEHEGNNNLKAHKRKASSGLQKDSTSETVNTSENSKKTKVDPKEETHDSVRLKEEDSNSPDADVASKDEDGSDAKNKVPLGDGPHEFLLWGDALMSLLDGDLDEEPPIFRLPGDVIGEHTRWCASGATEADRDGVYRENIRQWEVSIRSPDCAKTEGAQLLRDVEARVSAAAVPPSTGNDQKDRDLAEEWPWWFVLTVQRQEPTGLVPKLGGLTLDGRWGGGAPKDAQGEWWITDVKVAETATSAKMAAFIPITTTIL
ncbi:hypothetical protein Hypma_011115 [Hypsizygus marmoreus]|uniref:Uncharacterized protein n=1 Tax=Hypsizygus marmoreus TaxID=39966 RepID=A0A369JNC5_HYPMA|nr:hypothetical protein Hypma_011115 [Hypsizygus marmoreus]